MQSYLSRKKSAAPTKHFRPYKSLYCLSSLCRQPELPKKARRPKIGLVGSVGGPRGEADGEPASGGLRDDQL